ncbi:MAG: hypothetical protein AAGJ46_06675 [Planctomycetota bacterium]
MDTVRSLLVATAVLAGGATAQVFDPGPSNPSLFSTVITLPPDPDPGNDATFGSSTQVNLLDGGSLGWFARAGESDGSSEDVEVNIFGGNVGSGFSANAGSEVNISGGEFDRIFNANAGSVINVSGGALGRSFHANEGSVVNISGGSFIGGEAYNNGLEVNTGSLVNISGGNANLVNAYGQLRVSGGAIARLVSRDGADVQLRGGAVRSLNVAGGGSVEVYGGEFRIGGVTVTDDRALWLSGDLLTGVLADGSPIVWGTSTSLRLGDLKLIPVALPEVDTTPIVVNGASPAAPLGLRPGQSLKLQDGGRLTNGFTAVDASLVVEGGSVGSGARVFGGDLTVTGGDFDGGLAARSFDGGSTRVDIRGGRIGSSVRVSGLGTVLNMTSGTIVAGSSDSGATDGSVWNHSGGDIERGFDVDSGSTLNLSGGTIGDELSARSDTVVNISGGKVGFGFDASENAIVNLSGGSIGSRFRTESGAAAIITGGTVGSAAVIGRNSEIVGGDFRLNGEPYNESTILLNSLPATSGILTGTLSDGSTFLFATDADDGLGNVRLTTVPLPARRPSPTTVNTPAVDQPAGVREGEVLTVQAGGVLGDNVTVVGGTLNLEGGIIGQQAEVVDGEINIRSGELGQLLNVHSGGVVNVSGGSVGNFARAYTDATINVSGGEVGEELRAYANSRVSITGGRVAEDFVAYDSSRIDIRGGTVSGLRTDRDSGQGIEVTVSGGSINAFSANRGATVRVTGGAIGEFSNTNDADVEIVGGEFHLNGVPYDGAEFSGDGGGYVLTGVLADGSALILSALSGDRLDSVRLSRVALPTPIASPEVVDSPRPDRPSGLRPGQRLIVQNGGELGNNFAVVDADLAVEGGVIGDGTLAVGGHITLSSGAIGDRLTVQSIAGSPMSVEVSGGEIGHSFTATNTSVRLTGGSIQRNMDVGAGSRLDMSAGEIGDYSRVVDSVALVSGGVLGDGFIIGGDSDASISAGSFGSFFRVSGGRVAISGGDFLGDAAVLGGDVTISGGSFGPRFSASKSATVHLIGTGFLLDGAPMEHLERGVPFTFPDDEVLGILSGTLFDGSPFEFDLDRFDFRCREPGHLTITLVPEPVSATLATSLFAALVYHGRPPRRSVA